MFIIMLMDLFLKLKSIMFMIIMGIELKMFVLRLMRMMLMVKVSIVRSMLWCVFVWVMMVGFVEMLMIEDVFMLSRMSLICVLLRLRVFLILGMWDV